MHSRFPALPGDDRGKQTQGGQDVFDDNWRARERTSDPPVLLAARWSASTKLAR